MKAFTILAVVAGAIGWASAASAAPAPVQDHVAPSAYQQVQYRVYERHDDRRAREMRHERERYWHMREMRRHEWQHDYRHTYWQHRERERRMHAAHERWRERHYG
jgi:hypothetical protein